MYLSKVNWRTSRTYPKHARNISHRLMLKAGLFESSDTSEGSLTFLGTKILNELDAFIQNSFIAKNLDIDTFYSFTKRDLHDNKKGGLMYIDDRPVLNFSLTDKDIVSMNSSYNMLVDVLKEIVIKCGLTACVSKSENTTEVLIGYDAGKHRVATCKKCGYSKNVDAAKVYDKNEPFNPKPCISTKTLVHTPGATTVQAVCDMLGCKPYNLAKTLILSNKGIPVIAVVRGDRDLSVLKLKEHLNVSDIELADSDMILKITGADTGYASPMGLDHVTVLDNQVKHMTNFVTGANKSDYHYMNVNLCDFLNEGKFSDNISFSDISKIQKDDGCPVCSGDIDIQKAVLIGQVQKRHDEDPANTGSFATTCEIDLFKLMLCIIEQNNDDAGIIWPKDILKTKVYILPVNVNDHMMMDCAMGIYEKLTRLNIWCVLDDTDERAGAKFYDSDLLGLHYRITVGNKISQNIVELKQRNSTQILQVAPDKIGEYIV